MATKKENTIPQVIDTAEALEAKMKAMKEAQAISQPTPKNRLIKFSLLLLRLLTKPVSLLQNWQ